MVLWGTDNLKTEGGPIAQALALIGAPPALRRLRPPRRRRADPAGRARPAADRRGGHAVGHLPRPAAAADQAAGRGRLLAAAAPTSRSSMNFVRKHALAYQAAHGCDLETAALRVFGNAEGAYGANVNQHGRQRPLDRRGRARRDLSAPQGLRLRPQRPAGAAGRAARRACWPASSSPTRTSTRSSSASPPSTTISTRWAASAARCSARARRRRGAGLYRRPDPRRRARSARWPSRSRWRPAPACSTRNGTRACSQHGYEGVRQIEAHVTNTMGWSATTGQVAPWVYQQLSETFVLDPDDARAPGGAQPDRLGQGRQPPARGARPQLLDARRRDARGAARAPATNSRTGSKASIAAEMAA